MRTTYRVVIQHNSNTDENLSEAITELLSDLVCKTIEVDKITTKHGGA